MTLSRGMTCGQYEPHKSHWLPFRGCNPGVNTCEQKPFSTIQGFIWVVNYDWKKSWRVGTSTAITTNSLGSLWSFNNCKSQPTQAVCCPPSDISSCTGVQSQGCGGDEGSCDPQQWEATTNGAGHQRGSRMPNWGFCYPRMPDRVAMIGLPAMG